MGERVKVPVGAAVVQTEFQTTTIGDQSALAMEQLLIYLGQDGTAFYLGYREFGDGRAREPFRENATYKLPSSDEATDISYRGAKIRVYDCEVLEGVEKI
jgi:hypothetical protein